MLPRAVREQAERAERLHQEFLAANTGEVPAPAAPGPTESVAPVEPQQPAEPTLPQPTEPVPAPAPSADPLELKYKVLKGKYDAEVPRLSAENRDLKHKVADLERQIEALRAAPAAATSTSLAPESVVSTYGEDFVAAVDAIAEARAKKVRDEISSDVEVMKEATARTARDSFLASLERLVPNYAEIDRNPEFTAWLDEFDPMTGRVRRDFFQEADAANDAARIATFFVSFARSKATPRQAEAPRSVDHLIVPDSSARTEAQPGKRLWRRAEVNKVYSDARARRMSMAEFERLDADISAAAAEGRIID